jgi:hypothetical protein
MAGEEEGSDVPLSQVPFPSGMPPAQKLLLTTSIARTSFVRRSYSEPQAACSVPPTAGVTRSGLFSVLSTT